MTHLKHVINRIHKLSSKPTADHDLARLDVDDIPAILHEMGVEELTVTQLLRWADMEDTTRPDDDGQRRQMTGINGCVLRLDSLTCGQLRSNVFVDIKFDSFREADQ